MIFISDTVWFVAGTGAVHGTEIIRDIKDYDEPFCSLYFWENKNNLSTITVFEHV